MVVLIQISICAIQQTNSCSLSFVTEQVAEHTNGTIGALLNATFGNAPELLIATAALRSGFYRVVQLAMLGSMLTNLLFVFGISCLIGGMRWQVQELRITSGNVSVGMLLLSTAGSLLPATLVLGGQLRSSAAAADGTDVDTSPSVMQPTKEELQFCRVNAFVLIFMYGCYLVFQLGTHKEEFDAEENVVQTADANELHLAPHFTSRYGRQDKARRNVFCQRLAHHIAYFSRSRRMLEEQGWVASPNLADGSGSGDVELSRKDATSSTFHDSRRLLGMIPNQNEGSDVGGEEESSMSDDDASSSDEEGHGLLPQNEIVSADQTGYANGYFDDYTQPIRTMATHVTSDQDSFNESSAARLRRGNSAHSPRPSPKRGVQRGTSSSKKKKLTRSAKQRVPGILLPLGLADPSEAQQAQAHPSHQNSSQHHRSSPQMSFRVGIVWLFIITLGISAMSDILVDTIDGFARRLHISEVFTSMVIVPFFSNVAEQVSAILFAYRNEMDLCVGVTVGSAIQVAAFVLPGCVIIGWLVDRSMTLYFHAYETVCLLLSVLVVAAVLQGGTTNWLVGATCVSIYVMIATGFWFHSLEDLSVDAESGGVRF